MKNNENELFRCHCNSCSRETKHVLLASRETQDSEEIVDFGPIHWKDTYVLLECAGCESVSLKHTHYFDPINETTVSFYPPRVMRRKPLWIYQIPGSYRSLLEEIYQALECNSRSLALMGARTVLDMVMIQFVGDKGTFSSKLDLLVELGFIGRKNKEILDAAIDAGSAAAHRAYCPTEENMNAVMDIVENLLQSVFHLEILAERLKMTTPSRQSKMMINKF